MGEGSIFQQAFANLNRVPREAWLVALFANGLSASGDFAFWTSGERLSWGWAAPYLVLTAVWLWAIYMAVVGIVGRFATFPGYARFTLTSVTAVSPIALTLALAVWGKSFLAEGTRTLMLVVGLVISFIIASLLSGWPMAQSISAKFVSPARVLKATRGHRWSLLLLSFATAGIGRSGVIPDISKANKVSEAALIAIANGLIGLLTLGLTAAIAATAWQFVVRTDPSLDLSQDGQAQV